MIVGAEVDDVAAPRLPLSINAVNGTTAIRTNSHPHIIPIAQIVLQHHERLDGSGYPQGLTDGGILLEAKILAAADVVEAMASHRPYRPALGIGKTLNEISAKRGVLYDAAAVDACVRLFTEKAFKFN